MKSVFAEEELNYLDFFGLKHNPFPLAPDDESFYISGHINQILTEIIHGIKSRKGFMVLIGEVGLGKTTITRRLVRILEEKGVETSLVFHTTFQDMELLREINRDFGIEIKSSFFGDQMNILNDFLIKKNSEGKNCAIIIDDAQNLGDESLELVRMISNLETGRRKLVQILLVGQPELMEKLNTKKLRQLKSRIFIKKEPKPLNMDELQSYLIFKLNSAGNAGQTRILKEAFKKIHSLTKGNLRKVNMLADRCLYVAFFFTTTIINKKVVLSAYNDLFTTQPFNKKIFVLLLFFLLSSAAGILYSNTYFNASQNLAPFVQPAGQIYSKTDKKISEPVVSGHLNLEKERAEKKFDNSGNKVKEKSPIKIPDAVSDFLKPYELLKYKNLFFKSLNTDNFEEIKQAIYNDTGYQLVILDHVPENIRNQYGRLSFSGQNKEKFFIFWKPWLIVKNFYYFYKGAEILKLQNILAENKLYTPPTDNIVGINLMNAVINYQEIKSLPVTGFPDETTIFLLCH